MKDLDNDGTDEAIAFYRTPNETKAEVHMLVMYCANDEWKLSENCALDATDVDCVDFADVTGSGTLEILSGYTTYNSSINNLACHSYSNGKTNRLTVESSYSSFYCSDFDSDGVNEVISALRELGIVVVIEPRLPSTRLDGATLFTDNNVVIGLTIRFDRLDNFWFTLAHELAHAYLHSESDHSAFFDQLFNEGTETSQLENEADALAGELLIPTDTWRSSPLRYGSTPTLVKIFANKIGVHPSVVAGRIRHDSKDWSVHSDIVNDEKVRHLFEDKLW